MQDPPRPQPPSKEQIEALKPRGGFVLLGAPIVAIGFVFVAYGWLLFNGWVGRSASGPEATYLVSGCPEAAEVMRARVAEMGLPEPVVAATEGGFVFTVALPSAATDPEAFGETLSAPGRFAMHGGGEVLATEAQIASAGVRMDLTMTPATLVVLDDEGTSRVYDWMNRQPDERTRIELDGVEVWSFGNRKTTTNGEFEIPPSADDDRLRMELAASRGIILNDGPLPCPVTLQRQSTAP